MDDVQSLSPQEARLSFRKGLWKRPTSGFCRGYAQANLVVLPASHSFDFLLFCVRNPAPCPLLEVLEPGIYSPQDMAAGADIRTDLPLYRIYRHGDLALEVEDIRGQWREDLVTFLIGCSFTFDHALISAGIPLRHVEEKRNLSMFITNIECRPAGAFSGNIVVSMRPIREDMVPKAVEITSAYRDFHGPPLQIGSPEAVGIKDLGKPDFGIPQLMRQGEVPVFWACGVTPQAVAMNSRPPLMITHSPGHMFITDRREEEVLNRRAVR